MGRKVENHALQKMKTVVEKETGKETNDKSREYELKHTKPKKKRKPRNSPNPSGRPRKNFDINKAIELVTYRTPAVGIAQFFGISVQSLHNYLKEYGYKNFTDFNQWHNEKKINDVRKTLFDMATKDKNLKALALVANAYTEIKSTSDRNSSNFDGVNSKAMPRIFFLDDNFSESAIKLELEERAIALKKVNFLKHQWEFISDRVTKFLCLSAGFGSGKTHVFLRKVLIAHIEMTCDNGDNIGKSEGLIIYPTLKMGKALFWNNFLHLLDDTGIAYKKNIAELTIETHFGIIRLLGGEDPEKIVGYNASFVGIDELDTIKKSKEVWDNANARLRGREDSQLFTVSTPEGFKLLYKKFVKEPQEKIEKGEEILTKLIKAKTADNPFLPDDFIATLKDQYTEKQLRAYLNGEFVNFNGMSVYEFDREVNVGKINYNPKERIYVGMDFNVNPMSFILFHANVVYDDGNPRLEYFRVFKSVSLANSNTKKACKWIADNYPDKDITFIVDKSGDSRKTSAEKTDVEIIRSYNYKVNYLTNLSEKDKVNITNNELEKGRIVIDEREGNYLIEDLEAVTSDDTGKINKKDLSLTHQSDALAYSVAWLLRKRKKIDSFAGYGGLM